MKRVRIKEINKAVMEEKRYKVKDDKLFDTQEPFLLILINRKGR